MVVMVEPYTYLITAESLRESFFVGNQATSIGGAIFAQQSLLLVNEAIFIGNFAASDGSGMYSEQCNCTMIGTSFVNNSAWNGSIVVYQLSTSTCYNFTLAGNSGPAMMIHSSNVTFADDTTMIGNRNRNPVSGSGGAISIDMSSVSFSGHTLFRDNYAGLGCGGAVDGGFETTIKFSGVTVFYNNSAKMCGGAIEVSGQAILVMSGHTFFKRNHCNSGKGGAIALTWGGHMTVAGNITFESNWAEVGGAIYLKDSTITLKKHTDLVTSHNRAQLYGGAIFYVDNIDPVQCNFSMYRPTDYYEVYNLPDCYLKLENFKFSEVNDSLYRLHSTFDSAGVDGQYMYGGLIDKCRVTDYGLLNHIAIGTLYRVIYQYGFLQVRSKYNAQYVLSSEVYVLCLCNSTLEYNCIKQQISLSVIRGQRFTASVFALSQGGYAKAKQLIARVNATARLEIEQYSQGIAAKCSTVFYNMYSTKDKETLLLFPDGPCKDSGKAVVRVEVSFLPCPDAFIASGDRCVCDERLQKYNAECIVGDEENVITKPADSRFWMGFANESLYKGLTLYHLCPTDHCKTGNVSFSVGELNDQCGFHHRGLLCGGCAANYSVILGSSKCRQCSNEYLLLLIAFAAAGVLLVVLLSVLRLTVATGMIYSVILYVNILQANKSIFFQDSTSNILTVFLAWMNLDLGFPTCFYDGMDAYAHTWLEFAFPIYIWVLISVIILTSRYSTVMTRLLGSNPVAVLATLLLMSYAKILRTLVSVYSSVQLEYPANVARTVWLKDANVPYLQSKHLVLAVVSSLFTAIFFLPYTLFLLLGYKLYSVKNKCVHVLMIKMKPLLDSYYAPYKRHTRYWTGLLLLVRCALYVVFSFNSIGGTDRSLLAITITFTALIVVAWLSVKVY